MSLLSVCLCGLSLCPPTSMDWTLYGAYKGQLGFVIGKEANSGISCFPLAQCWVPLKVQLSSAWSQDVRDGHEPHLWGLYHTHAQTEEVQLPFTLGLWSFDSHRTITWSVQRGQALVVPSRTNSYYLDFVMTHMSVALRPHFWWVGDIPESAPWSPCSPPIHSLTHPYSLSSFLWGVCRDFCPAVTKNRGRTWRWPRVWDTNYSFGFYFGICYEFLVHLLPTHSPISHLPICSYLLIHIRHLAGTRCTSCSINFWMNKWLRNNAKEGRGIKLWVYFLLSVCNRSACEIHITPAGITSIPYSAKGHLKTS